MRRPSIHVPMAFMRANALVTERLPGNIPLTRDLLKMMEAGDNVVGGRRRGRSVPPAARPARRAAAARCLAAALPRRRNVGHTGHVPDEGGRAMTELLPPGRARRGPSADSSSTGDGSIATGVPARALVASPRGDHHRATTHRPRLGRHPRRAVRAPYADAGLLPGRVAVQHRGAYDVLTERGRAALRRRRPALRGGLLARRPARRRRLGRRRRSAGRARRDDPAVLPRRTKFSRKTAWQATEEQVLAANVDVVLIVTSLNEDLNIRRLERYLTLAWESGARPVLVLTKSRPRPTTSPPQWPRCESVAFGVPGARGLERHGRGPRRGARVPAARHHGGAPRLVGGRQVDAREQRSWARSCSRRRRSATTAGAGTRRPAASSSSSPAAGS